MYLIYICIILALHSLSAGEIVTTSDFEFIETEANKLDENSLILFDVDATLITPNDAILKPQWKDLFEQLIAGCTDRDLFREIRMQAPHSLVDNRSIDLVHNLQKRKVPVITLTAAPSIVRGMEEPGLWRVAELQKYGFDFSPAFPNSNFVTLPKESTKEHPPLFKSGVLYTSFHAKGDILIAFLHKISLKPNKVIFIDDELAHVQSVVTSLDQEGIPCLGIHYTAVNAISYSLNENHARFQVSHFIQNDTWIGDVK